MKLFCWQISHKVSGDEFKPRKDLHNKALRCWRYKLKKVTEDETPSYVYRLVLSKSVYELSTMPVKITNQFSMEMKKNHKIHKKAQTPGYSKQSQGIKPLPLGSSSLTPSYTNHL